MLDIIGGIECIERNTRMAFRLAGRLTGKFFSDRLEFRGPLGFEFTDAFKGFGIKHRFPPLDIFQSYGTGRM